MSGRTVGWGNTDVVQAEREGSSGGRLAYKHVEFFFFFPKIKKYGDRYWKAICRWGLLLIRDVDGKFTDLALHKKKKSVMLSAHATHTAVSDLLTSALSSCHIVRQLENVVTSHCRACVVATYQEMQTSLPFFSTQARWVGVSMQTCTLFHPLTPFYLMVPVLVLFYNALESFEEIMGVIVTKYTWGYCNCISANYFAPLDGILPWLHSTDLTRPLN